MGHPIANDRSEVAFGDAKPAMTREQAVAEADRCLFCTDAPCIAACPTSIDIPQFIRKISTGNVHGSAETIFRSNILGMSCARVCPVEVLCVGACVFNHMHSPPIQIGRLQRFATDAAFDAGWRFFEAGADSGRSVALLGAGPASLACAHELRRLGHRCTILEQKPVLGGLNTSGVAPYKMRADNALAEADWVLRIGGVDVKRGTGVDGPEDAASLESRYDAVFIGVGLGEDTPLRVPGENLPGVRGAVAWIEEMKLRRVDLSGIRRCVVVGGGNTAVDCVREAMGLSVESVTLLYRGLESAMPGYAHEWTAARAAGATAEWRALPTAFEGDGRVQRVRCTRVDEHRRPVAGTEFTLEADLVLIAIGQARLGQMFGAMAGIRLENGRIVTDAAGATGRPGWFAGGDCANGGKEVVNAAAEGKRAAGAIHEYLRRRTADQGGPRA
ncbi:MAG: FAD-dependent oxidoreductase [Phycisphaerales bacterium]